MIRRFFGLALALGLAVCWTNASWSQRSRSNRSDIDDLIYNEQIDERTEEEKKSEAERLIDAVRSIKDENQPHEGRREREEKPPEAAPVPAPDAPPMAQPGNVPPPAGGRVQEKGSETVISGDESAPDLRNRPTMGILIGSPDLLVNQEMQVEVILNNPNRVLYDALAYTIKYDPAVLEVIDQLPEVPGINIQDASAAELGLEIGPKSRLSTNLVDPSRGLIYFLARLPEEGGWTSADGVVGRFTVRALRERGNTSLQFENMLKGGAIDVFLDRKRKDRNAAPESGTFLRMLDSNNKSRLLDYEIPKFGAQARILPSMDDFLSGPEKDYYDTAIRLVPTRDQVQVGEEFDVLVELVNPNQVAFDSVLLYMLYDHRVLEAVDRDDNNWITQGINIHDGDYRDKFPLELCKANRIDPKTGEIIYSMATFHEPVSASGVFASIRFRALRPVKSTNLLFGFNLPNRFPTTGIFRRQQDLLAGTGNYRDGVYSSPISIYP